MEEKTLSDLSRVELLDYFKKIIQLKKDDELNNQKIEEVNRKIRSLESNNKIVYNTLKIKDYVKSFDINDFKRYKDKIVPILSFILVGLFFLVSLISIIIDNEIGVLLGIIILVVEVVVFFYVFYYLFSIFSFLTYLFYPILKVFVYIFGVFKYFVFHKRDDRIRREEKIDCTNSNEKQIEGLKKRLIKLEDKHIDIISEIRINSLGDIHEDYDNIYAYQKFIGYLEKGRCDSFKECINLYEQELKQEQMANEIDSIRTNNKKLETEMNNKLNELDNQMYDVKVKTEAQEMRVKDNLENASYKYRDYIDSTYKRAKNKVDSEKTGRN